MKFVEKPSIGEQKKVMTIRKCTGLNALGAKAPKTSIIFLDLTLKREVNPAIYRRVVKCCKSFDWGFSPSCMKADSH